MLTVVGAVLALALLAFQFPVLPGGLAGLPVVAPGPVLLGAALGGPRWALGAWLLARVLAAAAAGVAAALPVEPARVDAVVTGTVSEFPKSVAGRLQFVLDVEATAPGLPGLRRVQVTWYAPPATPPAPGERWRLGLRLRAPRGLANPGAFDYERWLFAQRIDAIGYVRDAATGGLLGEAPGPAAALLRARAGLARRISAAAPEGGALPYLLGLSVGVYAALPEAEWELLRRTGLVHLVSVSGFHLTLVALPLALAGAFAAVAVGRFGRGATPRVAGAVVALSGATAYGGLAGFTVPTLRSLLMLAALAACVAARRGREPAGLLALAAAGALAIDPLGLLTPGFWLSFGGVLALATAFGGAGAGRVAGSGVGARGLLARAGIAARGLGIAQVATGVALLPLSLAWFGQVSVTGSLANLVAIPFFSVAVLPPILAGALLAAVDPGWASPVLGVATATLAAWRATVAWFAGLPYAFVELPLPSPLALGVGGLGVVLALWPRPWPLRALAPACLLPLVLARAPAPPPGGFEATVIDVGQGLAVLIRTAGHALLYDAGPAWGGADAGARAVLPVLRDAGVIRLDRVIISHGDSDHAGGARAVLARYPGARLYATQWQGPPVAGRRPCLAGLAWHWDGVDFRVLHPADASARGGDNELSCVLAIGAAAGSMLLTGDIGAPSEAALASGERLRPTDLVVAPHHGSRSSSSPAFIAALRPRHVVFATGHANRWGFPRPEVVERWRAAGACTFDTAAAGALRFVAEPGAGLRFARAERLAFRPVWRRPGTLAACARRPSAAPVYSGAGLVAP